MTYFRMRECKLIRIRGDGQLNRLNLQVPNEKYTYDLRVPIALELILPIITD